MPVKPTYPGVYIEEVPAGVHSIPGVPTSVTAIVGYTHPHQTRHYGKAVKLRSFAEYAREFGGLSASGLAAQMPWAAKQFFANGGTELYAVGLRPGNEKGARPGGRGDTHVDPQPFAAAFREGSPLDQVPLVNLVLTPGVFDTTVTAAALAFAERKRAFVILDLPRESATDAGLAKAHPPARPLADFLPAAPRSRNAALYFPYLRAADPLTGQTIEVAPSGFVAGVYARTDNEHGVWKAPAGTGATVTGTLGAVARGTVTDQQQEVLATVAPVNCLREFAGAGTVVWGARTLAGDDPDYKYVPVRRFALFLEQSLDDGLRWVSLEPNAEPLWASIRGSVGSFMLSLFKLGALQGAKPEQAYFIKCDGTTTTAQDIANGIVNVVVGFAPLKPAEFVIVSLAILAAKGPPG